MASCFYLKKKNRYPKEANMLLWNLSVKEDVVAKQSFFNTNEQKVAAFQSNRNTFVAFDLYA